MSDLIVEISNLSVGYKDKVIVKEINDSIKKGSLVFLLGANGTGKSTILKTIAGLQPYSKGNLKIKKLELKKLPLNVKAKTIAFLPSKTTSIENVSVQELISFARIPHRKWFQQTTIQDEQLIEQICNELDIVQLLSKNYEELSDGQKQKVNIARCLAQETDLIILDEPTAHLDIVNKKAIFKLIDSLVAKGKTIICTTHDVYDAFPFASQFWIINEASNFNSLEKSAVKTVDDLIEMIFNNK